MHMGHLSIEEYDALEREARIAASYPAIRAFSPVAFSQVNFPTRVAHEQELRRYADIMYELLPRQDWLDTKRYTEREAGAIQKVVSQIYEVTARHFQKPVAPLMCLFPPIPIVRAVEAIASVVDRRLKIFEIGPGSGHLGAYLINAEHRYAAMDNCQSLYLWQNRFFSGIATDYSEWASREMRQRHVFERSVTHIPWWDFAQIYAGVPPMADVVICDAALGEMDVFAVRYVLRLAKLMLTNPIAEHLFFRIWERSG